MRGKMTVLFADGSISSKDWDRAPSLNLLQTSVGGYIETVPRFEMYQGEKCVAFCNEEGKLNGLPRNHKATELWFGELASCDNSDYLVGNIVILQGDEEFLDSL